MGTFRFFKLNEKFSGTPTSFSRRFASARDFAMSCE